MRIISNKRAVSQIISTLIIVGTLFAMFAIIYPWSIQSLTLSQSRANAWYSSQEAAAQERFVMEMAYFNSTAPESIDIYIRNVGEIDIEVDSIYINETLQSTINPALPAPIYVKTEGNNNIVKFNIAYTWENDKTYRFIIVTERGQRTFFESNSPS